MTEEILKAAAEKGRQALWEGVFRDGKGVLRCAVCGEPREARIPGLEGLLPVACACFRKAEEEKAARKRSEEARNRVKNSPFWSPGYAAMNFGADDAPDSEASTACRRYAEGFGEAEKEGLGLLFNGPPGTGKTFYAASVVNALTERGVPAVILSAARLVNLARAAREPQRLLDELNRFPLVALDDLGAERTTDFAGEVLENFVDARSVAGRPLLVTTNLTGKELRNPSEFKNVRLFDRVLALCPYAVLLTGPSRRAARQEAGRERLKALLEGDHTNLPLKPDKELRE